MEEGVDKSRKARIISKALPGASKALAGVANLIKIASCETPEILSIEMGCCLIPRISQALMMLAKKHFREGVEPPAVPRSNAAFRSGVVIERLVNVHETLACADHSNVDVPVFPIADLFVVHTNRKKLLPWIKWAASSEVILQNGQEKIPLWSFG